ncbi:MAG: hypothetical protein H6740_17195 [Alphaproteobacteria bacterium]|nr:hypothetical protein [Alphaproteobacteria bacterium]
MPELPEVEIATRNVRRWTRGRRLRRLELLDPRLVVEATRPPEALAGAQVLGCRRRAKYLILETDLADLVWHFRMTGKLVPDRPGGRTRARLHLDEGDPIAFKDSRCLGELWLLPPGEALPWLQATALGPEPFPEPQPGEWWAARLAGLRGALKPALMRQDRIAGLGNIAASEICWRARLDPQRPCPTLDAPAHAALAREASAFLHEIVALEAGDEIAYLNDGPRDAPNPFAIYGREGEPCPRCGAPVRRFPQAGRSTFWCPPCQRSSGGQA